MVHGIPDSRPLDSKDIVNFDVSVYLGGFHGDCSASFLVSPEVDQKGKDLLLVTRECLELGISQCKPGRPFNVIGKAIQ